MSSLNDIIKKAPSNTALKEAQDKFTRRFELRHPERFTQEQQEYERQYWDKVHGQKEGDHRPPLDYETARVLLWRIMAKFSHAFRGDDTSFEVDDYNRALIQNMLAYFIGEDSKLSPEKGILIWGNPGTGKTVIFRIFSEFTRLPGVLHRFNVLTCTAAVNNFSQLGVLVVNKYKQYNRCFDDLGAEPAELKLYGNSNNPMAQILTARYERWERDEAKTTTFMTSNLSPNAIGDRYGLRVFDRLRQMCNIIEIKGPSRR